MTYPQDLIRLASLGQKPHKLHAKQRYYWLSWKPKTGELNFEDRGEGFHEPRARIQGGRGNECPPVSKSL